MELEHPEDRRFFEKRLCRPSESLERYAVLFDLRPPKEKRGEFNRMRKTLLAQLIGRHGETCMLGYPGLCDIGSGLTVDHIIPLSSNMLNKELRKLPPIPGKKVRTQSFGSNHPDNLVLACANCNNHKKHRFLEAGQLRRILDMKCSG